MRAFHGAFFWAWKNNTAVVSSLRASPVGGALGGRQLGDARTITFWLNARCV